MRRWRQCRQQAGNRREKRREHDHMTTTETICQTAYQRRGDRDASRARGNHGTGHRRTIADKFAQQGRSEEHTSELQSLMRISYAVFCLKKKKQKHESSRTPYQQTNKQQENKDI